MKKILTSLFALAAVFCASAEVPTYSVSPADGSTIENRENLTVTFTFSEAVKADSVQFASGPRFNRYMTEAALSMTAPSTTISVQVPATAWGEVVGSEYLLTVTLTNMSYADGTPITIEDESETGEVTYLDFKAAASYTSPDTTAVEYIGLDPDPATTTVWEVYNDGWGFVNFLFNGAVGLAGSAEAVVTCYLNDGNEITFDISRDDLWADWDFWTGGFAITVPIMYDEAITQSTLIKIEVELYDVVIGGEEKEFNAVYALVSAPQRISKGNTASSKMTISPASSNIVYDIHGNKVLTTSTQSIKDLPAGIYIMDGKKFIVR